MQVQMQQCPGCNPNNETNPEKTMFPIKDNKDVDSMAIDSIVFRGNNDSLWIPRKQSNASWLKFENNQIKIFLNSPAYKPAFTCLHGDKYANFDSPSQFMQFIEQFLKDKQ